MSDANDRFDGSGELHSSRDDDKNGQSGSPMNGHFDEKAFLRDLQRFLALATEQLTRGADVPDRLTAIEQQMTTLCEVVGNVLRGLDEENRRLRAKEIDDYCVMPVALRIIEVIDRVCQEISEPDNDVPLFSFVEDCRLIDREELLGALAVLGIDMIAVSRGEKLNSRAHKIFRVRPTHLSHKVGRVARVIRPGYQRRRDEVVVRPVLVEAWGSAGKLA